MPASLGCGRNLERRWGDRNAVDCLEIVERRGSQTSRSEGMNDAARASEVQVGEKVLAPAGAQHASPRRKPWDHRRSATRSPARGERFFSTDAESPRNRLAVPRNASYFRPAGARQHLSCAAYPRLAPWASMLRPKRGWAFVLPGRNVAFNRFLRAVLYFQLSGAVKLTGANGAKRCGLEIACIAVNSIGD